MVSSRCILGIPVKLYEGWVENLTDRLTCFGPPVFDRKKTWLDAGALKKELEHC